MLELTRILENAADGMPGAVEAFFELLLRSQVFVPVKDSYRSTDEHSGALSTFTVGADSSGGTPLAGESRLDQLGFIAVNYDGKQTLPIFSEEAFVHELG